MRTIIAHIQVPDTLDPTLFDPLEVVENLIDPDPLYDVEVVSAEWQNKS